MVAKFAVVRAGRNYEAGIGSYTPLMGAWHRFPSICLCIMTINNIPGQWSVFLFSKIRALFYGYFDPMNILSCNVSR